MIEHNAFLTRYNSYRSQQGMPDISCAHSETILRQLKHYSKGSGHDTKPSFTAFDDQLVRCNFHQLSGREIFCQIFIYLKEKKCIPF